MSSKSHFFNNRSTFDLNALLYLNNSKIFDLDVRNKVNNFFIDLKTNSLYNKIKAGWLFVGNDRDKNKLNIINPFDADSFYRLTTLQANTSNNLGSTDILDTHFILPNELDISNCGTTVTSGAGTAGGKIAFGALSSGTERFSILITTSATGGVLAFRIQSQIVTSNTDAVGIYTNQKINATEGNVFKNGLKIINDTSITGNLPTNSMYLNAINNGSINSPDDKRLQTCLIHEGLTDFEVETLHTIIDDFENNLGRKTW
jgi:hypothetical protein